jgi:seryl-tRNA synthetase
MLNAIQLEERLLQFTREKLAPAEMADVITVDTLLFEDRVIDSLRILELIAFLQSALGRKIQDSQIVLANFRSISTIARVFTGVGSLTERRRGKRTTPARPGAHRSAVDELLARRTLEVTPDGALRMRGSVPTLRDFLDSTICDWANELGATASTYPDEIAIETLDRAGFLSAFPDKLVRTEDAARSPAVCYHHYPTLADSTINGPGTITTAIGRCYRNEFDGNAAHPVERLREFTMREIIAVGSPQFVENIRADLISRVERWLQDLGLDGAIETATDPFFTEASRGRLLMQQLLPLKYELRLRVAADRTVAAASFNNHHHHFGKAFGIRLSNGEPASSGCVAFGWERWILAFVSQHGPDERNWPLSVRNDVAASA